ncbi:right-handed parallel beta-helix repeat-containing protein [Pedobacter mucosus]|uniref:right-handed parallel beta-helix repeat-containing protein n=1 Tax=Pedobacter mucosus TaxID=2895286 RepID=UPI001EE3E6DF|nr:right-handed parallel beta-helix repeat-containing protein [Pedobacter mucosus]UKT64890.1 right-handed parallel beta-helix repeat-containing protein [Pedobacter mucosus]
MKTRQLLYQKFKHFSFFAAAVSFATLSSCHKEEVASEVQTKLERTMLVANAKISSLSLPGNVLREVWNMSYGNDVAQIPIQNNPSATTQLSSLEGPIDDGENYGTRIRGYITPPETGNYTFWISADDSGEMWLSTDEQTKNKEKIAYTLSWNNSREWNKFNTQKSKEITLEAGHKYYLEILQKQGGGGGNLAVQWMLPDGKIESPIPGNRLEAYSETVEASYASSPSIDLYDKHDITISGKSLTGGSAPVIKLNNCSNIRIIGNRLSNSSDVGIYLYNCKNITIEDNFFTNVSTGVYADHTQGGIVVNGNQFLNMQGPFPRGQFVQFNNVKGAGSSISNNRGENIIGRSYAEDAISLYQSEGTASSPILINGNLIRGGGPSLSGGGIMLGDQGGSYLYASDNILVDPGQFGMAIAGGHHVTVVNNTIFGRQQLFTNVGLYVNDIGGWRTSDCKVTNNKVRYYNKTNYQNNAWLSPNSVKPEGWDANIWGAEIDPSLLPSQLITKK